MMLFYHLSISCPPPFACSVTHGGIKLMALSSRRKTDASFSISSLFYHHYSVSSKKEEREKEKKRRKEERNVKYIISK